MNKTSVSILILLLVSLFSERSHAQIAKFSNDFLSIGVSADAMAMGNSVTASVTDATAIFWNPGALTLQPEKLQIAFMHSEYFAGIAKYDFGAFSVQLDSNKHAFGLGFIRFAVDDIPNTLDLVDASGNIDYNKVTSFAVGDYSIFMTYSRNIVKNLSVGATVKIITRRAGDINVQSGFSAKSWGFGIDLGAVYKIKDFKIGLQLKDITTTFNAWSFEFTDDAIETFQQTGNAIPTNSQELTAPQIILGFAYHKMWKDKIELRAEVDFDITTDGKRNVLITGKPFSVNPHFGVEFGFAGIIYGRAGINNIQKVLGNDNESTKITIQPNIGGGIKFRTFSVDYAFTDIGNVSEAGYSHVVSAKVGLNLNKKNKEE
ncbi:MAG: conjugal transfer protein TraF [Bacteroidetes bacterium]|nr:conjugal transfer protein TraF [Bacteroidota bacterium]